MLCILCGAEMRLAKVEPNETGLVAGFEHHTFECTGCDEVERRLTFTRHDASSAEPVPVHPAPPVAPGSPDHVEPAPTMGESVRALAELRGREGP
jgi:hypothetical protein